MTVFHIVMFEFNASASAQEIEDVCHRFLDLRDTCVRKGTEEKYIVGAKGGRNCCGEGGKVSFTHGFVMEFASDEDRMYYVKEDPAHQGFVKSLEGVVAKVGVLDFVPDVF
ncbi:MAG: hypothetical protein LQ338_001951 [Usnochroma carphineum]|nr:MAG: hypothetical protein LQ338_001951 [Usnochroma carphineum]